MENNFYKLLISSQPVMTCLCDKLVIWKSGWEFDENSLHWDSLCRCAWALLECATYRISLLSKTIRLIKKKSIFLCYFGRQEWQDTAKIDKEGKLWSRNYVVVSEMIRLHLLMKLFSLAIACIETSVWLLGFNYLVYGHFRLWTEE